MFRHKFSLLVVGPTQCGKTFFFEKILSTDCILYESKKSRPIWCYYSQWQDRYKVMQSSIGKEWKIETDIFAQGRSQRKIFPRKEPNECSINLSRNLFNCFSIKFLTLRRTSKSIPHRGTKEGWMEALPVVFDMLQYFETILPFVVLTR